MNLDSNGNQEKTVVLVNRAMYLPGEGGYKRTMYLYDLMKRLGHKPILLTSDFNHYKKSSRNIDAFKRDYPDYKDIVFLHTRSYKKNISFQRKMAENDWTKGVAAWIKQNAKDIDVIMLSMPDMNTILKVNSVCKNKQIQIVIDVRDLRPEAFRVVFKNELLYKLATFSMKKRADRAYACADKLFAVSEEYLERGCVKNSHAQVKKAIYIGSVIEKFDVGIQKYSNSIEKPNNELWLTYIGTLGTSYDLVTVIDAVNILKDIEFDNKYIKLIILGQGPDKTVFEEHARRIGATNVRFIGFVEYEKMAAYLHKSDLTINAIKRRGSQSIINKVADYLAAGVPMLNGCTCKEQQNMIENYKVGINYEPENADSLVEAIETLAKNSVLRHNMGVNARKLAESKFDRNRTYRELIDLIYE